MSKVSKSAEHPEEQLWKELKHVRAGMLGIEGSRSHMQPMAPSLDRDNGRLWFFTSRDTDLFREIGAGTHAHFCVIGKHQDYHACLMGKLQENMDRAKIDEYWSDYVGAWFDGKDDPKMTLLSLDLVDAAIWASINNPVKFGWEIEKAKNNQRDPDVGVKANVAFAGGGAIHESSGRRS
jgi:general stress protein 26